MSSLIRLICLLGLLAWPLAAHAQEYPTKAIKFVVPFPAGGPPDPFARVVPLSRHSLTKRTALAGETPNRSAAARRDMPPSTARITRTRRSSDMGFAIRAGLLIQHAA